MQIEFQGEAYESFQKIVFALAGYTVEVTINTDDETYPDDAPARFDAKLIGPDLSAEWGDTVRVQHFNDETGTGEGDAFSVRAERILVY